MTKQNIITLKETTYAKPTELYAVVEKCVWCGDKHIHAGQEGNVVAHCINQKISRNYDLLIDRDDPENVRLAVKYGIQL